MQRLYDITRRLSRDVSGATAIEYGLLAAGISVVIIGTVFLIGPALNDAFNTVLVALENAPAGTQ